MFVASIFSHMALGVLLSVFFVLYYIHGDGKSKLFLEFLIGMGGNAGGIFLLDNWLEAENPEQKMYSVGSCIVSFLVGTFILMVVFSQIIKDKNNKDLIRLRDILLGQTAWIKKYYENRAKEIDSSLNIQELKKRETAVEARENIVSEKERFIKEEKENLEKMGEKKLRMVLPESMNVSLNKEYVDSMPSYFESVLSCILNMDSCTGMILERPVDTFDVQTVKSYFMSLATYISSDIFGDSTSDVRIHFRRYDSEKAGYVKLVSVIGKSTVDKEMTVIPYDGDSMIRKSYECRRALIKSLNIDHDFKSRNSKVWEDYLTYTFYDVMVGEFPLFSFGISVRNAGRYKRLLYFLNFIKFEYYLQKNVEQINEHVNMANLF